MFGNMLKSTFIFIPGVGEETEKHFWKNECFTWKNLKEGNNDIHLSENKRRIIKNYLNKASKAIKNHDASFFAEHLPQKEHWRAYKEFRNKTVFLDIETTGISLHYDKITLIGTFDGLDFRVFVKDNNLEEIVDYLKNFEMVVTFNGKLFDIPFIKKEFPELKIPPIHLDLRFILKSLGLTGPLKEIEAILNIPRPKDVQNINGRAAAVLWSKFVKGDNNAFERLLLYNLYDTIDLRGIMDFCYNRKIDELNFKLLDIPSSQLLKFSRYEIDYSLMPLPEITTRQNPNGILEIEIFDNGLPLEKLKINPNKLKKIEVKISDLIQRIRLRGYTPTSVGIDLSSSEKRPTGICILNGKDADLDIVKTDEEIISRTLSVNPTVISIDSPLTLPRGRCCIEDSCECRKYGILRECERILKDKGINVFPCLINSMQKLTARGIRLADRFRKNDYIVIESYPGAAQDVLGIPRKRVDLKALEIELMDMGIIPSSNRETITHDELDALTSALVGYFYLANLFEPIGNDDEDYLIIPSLESQEP